MQRIKKISIIGVGFMGASLALSLRKKYPHIPIWGYARNKKAHDRLKKIKVLDKVERNLEKLTRDSDIIILAAPIDTIISYFSYIVPFVKKGAIVIDLGSSKEFIQKSARRILPSSVDFVGCHPLCGSEKSGARFARASLYQGSLCFITSSRKKKATQFIAKLWENLGVKIVFISAARHDKILSSVSHLPHFLSFAITAFLPANYTDFVGTSFKDMTRISMSSAKVWADIFLSNKKNILEDIKKYQQQLKIMSLFLKKMDKKSLIKEIDKIAKKQQRINS